MSRPQEPMPAKLIVGLLFSDFGVQLRALLALEGLFGPMDFLSEPIPFHYTTYYDEEMGGGIFRQWGSFVRLVQPGSLTDVKLLTNRAEIELSSENKRRVNIDPGILSKERLVLATGKNFTHRIYLRDGIYADLTLIYQKGAFQPLPWTFPDYREARLLHYLAVLRLKLVFQLRGRLPMKPFSPLSNLAA
jgi:hypothetical protein